MNKTKIVCTLGPASYDEVILKQLIQSGLNVARFNFSHADYKKSRHLIQVIKKLNSELKTNVGLMLDTKGPEIRTHEFVGLVTIKKNSLVRITTQEILGNEKCFSVTYENFYEELNIGDIVHIDDGYLSLKIIEKDVMKKELVTIAQNNHVIKSRRGINVPNVKLKIPFISPKDRQDIIFAVQENYDYIAASFVRKAQDVFDIRTILKENKNNRIQIISKIENQEGLDNLDEILKVSDGIMIARGDLGIEIPGELVPLYQTRIITKCLSNGKPVIVATQMLESMQKNPRPTKAEISDVFNAIKEGSSCTMLSGESASGDYPLQSVIFMNKINYQAEKVLNYQKLSKIYQPQTLRENFLLSAVELALRLTLKAIVVQNFEDACNLFKFHPSVPVLVLVKNNEEARALSLNFSVLPFLNQEDLDFQLNILNSNSRHFILIRENKLEIQ